MWWNQCRCFSSSADSIVRMAFDRFPATSPVSNVSPLVIGHGLFGSKRNWQSLGKALQRQLGVDVYAIDFRNHGESPHRDEHSFSAMANDLAAFLEQIREETNAHNFNLLGHSMGGIVMSHFALTAPNAHELVNRFIVEDIAPNRPISESTIPDFVRAMKRVDLRQSRKEIDHALKHDIPNESIRQFLLMNLIQDEAMASAAWRWQINLDAIERSFDHVFRFTTYGHFDRPTLFLSGGNSNYIKPTDREPLKAMFPNATFYVIPDARHWIHTEQPKLFIECVTNFLKV